ncbi:MAG: hypothetical protein HDT21_06915 [Ruminococcus sp.]|nr:hypothetical protein [Ruminococcus sp.]
MKKIIECSSIYAIDFAAVIYSIVNDYDDEYILYINDVADTKSEYRKFISRLALPTLNWELDPQGQLRQVHIPIENLTKDEFIKNVCKAFNSYIATDWLNDKDNYFIEFKSKLYERILKCNDFGIEAYKELIKLIIELVTGKEVNIANFSEIRIKGDYGRAKKFMHNVYNDILALPVGDFKFVKGGKIEIYADDKWISIGKFSKQKKICFYGNDGKTYSFKELLSTKKIRFRGPLETVFLCQYGILIDLPWYLDADISDSSNFEYIGEEYISPISVDSLKRVSKKVNGDGNRLVPSGYSLIEYKSDKVLRLLEKLYNEDVIIQLEDLRDWKKLINNYPVAFQKIAKSQTSVHELCNILVNCRFKKITNGLSSEKIVYKNYITLGENLVELCTLMKSLRIISNRKSPYYCKLDYINNFYLSIGKEHCLSELYTDVLMILNKCLDFFAAFQYKTEIVLDCKLELEKKEKVFKQLFLCYEYLFDDTEFYHSVSKIEGKLKKCLYTYYELATFISGVLLKANIFASYCLLGNEYNCCIKEIIAQRKIKKLYFKPIYIERN